MSAPLHALAKYLEGKDVLTVDPSVNLLVHVAGAYTALEELKQYGVDKKVTDPLQKMLDQIHREGINIRIKMNPQQLDTRLISRAGRIHNG